MLEIIKRIFTTKSCETCAAIREMHNQQISILKDEIDYLRGRLIESDTSLLRAMRLEPGASKVSSENRRIEPIASGPRSWSQMQRDLEKKHQRTPEAGDVRTAEYWKNKNDTMEREALEFAEKIKRGELNAQGEDRQRADTGITSPGASTSTDGASVAIDNDVRFLEHE